MLSSIIKFGMFFLFSVFIIFFYYKVFLVFPQSYTYSLYFYLIFISIFYGIFKYFQLEFRVKSISFGTILTLFLLNLFLVSCFFFYSSGFHIGNSIGLFFKIMFFCLFPIFLFLINTAFGKKILSKLPDKNLFSDFWILELILGFSIFVSLLTILGIFGILNIYIVLFFIFIITIFSYKQILDIVSSIFSKKIEIKKPFALPTIIKELLYIFCFFVLAVALIYIYRPFPIGWDDLGAYMNYPKLMASSNSLLSLGGMYSWQTFTSLGFLFGSEIQAFFLNISGLFLSFIFCVPIFKNILGTNEERNEFLPVLLSSIFISLPMVGFQTIKDLKVDEGLFFVSIGLLYFIYQYFFFLKDGKKFSLKYLFIFGIIAGFAFSIKFTSLLLIIGILGILFNFYLGFVGFLFYIFSFFAVFTIFDFWSKLNLVIGESVQNIAGFGFLFLSFLFFIFLLLKKIKVRKIILPFFLFLLGIILALSPWFAKNTYDSYPHLSINNLILGKSESFNFDIKKILNNDQIKEIFQKQDSRKVKNASTTNEDLLRYLGYDDGIISYVYMFWNITMQKNQKGEYTNISFLFLAFIPAIFLFLPFRKKYLYIPLAFILLLSILFYNPYINLVFLKLFGNINLPLGYLVLFSLFGSIFSYLYFCLNDNSRDMFFFRLNLVFSFLYIFLWLISSFGIVWYGIVMYFNMLLMIGFGMKYFLKQTDIKFKYFNILTSGLLGFIFLIYFFVSCIPYIYSNLSNSSFAAFKSGNINSWESIFSYHPYYKKILFNLNISKDKRKEFLLENINPLLVERVKILRDLISSEDIEAITNLLKSISVGNFDKNIKIQARYSLNNIYKNLQYIDEKFRNKENIYRVGTFLKYYIGENNLRVFDDNLIFTFDDYLYSKDLSETYSKLKKLGIKYLIVDLNAATIDKSKNRYLTNRYEKLLTFLSYDKLELISTNSICFKVGLEYFHKNKDIIGYKNLAGINFNSYDKNGAIISRSQKHISCAKYILEVLNKNIADENNFSFLNPYKKIDDLNLEKILSTISNSSLAVFELK